MKTLFSEDQNLDILKRFKINLARNARHDGSNVEFENSRDALIVLIIESMIQNPHEWDKNCQINIQWIGTNFINLLSESAETKLLLVKDRLDSICAKTFRFMLELHLSTKNDQSFEFEKLRLFVMNNIDLFAANSKEEIKFAIFEMPIALFKLLANSDAIASIKDLAPTYERISKLRSDWDTELKEKEQRVNALKEALSEYETGFNFVALYKGFDELSKDKLKELGSLEKTLIWLGAITLMPIFLELTLLYCIFTGQLADLYPALFREEIPMANGEVAIVHRIPLNILLASAVPFFSLLIIFIYYFRVVLFNYRAVKSQLLQIELRKTLCRFIQSYVTYSKEIKEKDVELLSKFENIIFSGIVSDEGNLPSTYDGIEQIIKVLKSAKS